MTKKKETKTDVVVEETPQVVEQPKTKVVEKLLPEKDSWEIKDRTYFLISDRKPLAHIMKVNGLYWFDEEKGYERELMYCENQRTCFADEMKGEKRLAHVIFRNGALFVPREKTVLQKLLSLYHPFKDQTFYEYMPSKVAENEVDYIEMEIQALNIAKDMEIDLAEAIMRAEIGSEVSKMSSKELRRDLLVFAKRNATLFLELASDENVYLRNTGIKATEENIISLSSDQRTFSWTTNGRKLMNVPYGEHPYSALAAWFKTDEGMEIYTNIEKRLN